MSEMGDMKFTTAGDMMMDLPTLLMLWAQNEEMVASGVMTEHGHDCMLAASKLRDMQILLDDYDAELLKSHALMDKMRDAIRDLAKHVWRGDWDKLHPDTRALVGEK